MPRRFLHWTMSRHAQCVLSAAILTGSLAAPALAAPAEVVVPGDKIFPESLGSTSDGTLYIGSVGTAMVYRAMPGATTAEPFIEKDANGLMAVYGVLADEKSNTLWVCNNPFGVPADQAPPAELKSFDLKTGDAKGTYAFIAKPSFCNDIAVGSDGTVYTTDTRAGTVLRLKPGATALETWFGADAPRPGIDGLAFGPKGSLYVNNVREGTLFRIDINADGSASKATDITLPAPLQGPDGMRPSDDGNLWVAENKVGNLTKLVLSGDTAKPEVVKDGLGQMTGVTQVGDTVWTVASKLAYLSGDKKGQDPGTFGAIPVAVGQ